MLENNILASRTIHTRAYPNPKPPEIVDNPKSILKKSPTPKIPTISSHIHRANSTPEDFTALSDIHLDLDLPSKLPRTRSFSALDQPELELLGSPPRETPPSTPPDIHFVENLGLSHPKSAQQTSTGPSIPVIYIPAVQANPLPPQNTIMAA